MNAIVEEHDLIDIKLKKLLSEWKFLSLSKEKLIEKVEKIYDKEVSYETRDKKFIEKIW